jgi:hypothetical protein
MVVTRNIATLVRMIAFSADDSGPGPKENEGEDEEG